MKSALSPFVKSLLVVVLAASAVASAAEEKTPPAPAKPDPAKGATLYANGDPARGVVACVTCHGAAGNSSAAAYPKLAGQHDAYIYKQLVDFTKPERSQPIMTPYAKALTDTEKKDLAAYLGGQAEAPGAARNKDIVELGKKIYRGGIAEKSVPACASCHGAGGAGVPVQYPRISGQHQDYTAAQLTAFRLGQGQGARMNSPQMASIAKRMSDDEIKAVSDYIAGLK